MESLDDMYRSAIRVPVTVCADGFTVSIQASAYTYCTPRNSIGPYTHVELDFPSERPPDYIMEFAENAKNPMETVYGWVPVPLMEKMLWEHGGRITLSL